MYNLSILELIDLLDEPPFVCFSKDDLASLNILVSLIGFFSDGYCDLVFPSMTCKPVLSMSSDNSGSSDNSVVFFFGIRVPLKDTSPGDTFFILVELFVLLCNLDFYFLMKVFF